MITVYLADYPEGATEWQIIYMQDGMLTTSGYAALADPVTIAISGDFSLFTVVIRTPAATPNVKEYTQFNVTIPDGSYMFSTATRQMSPYTPPAPPTLVEQLIEVVSAVAVVGLAGLMVGRVAKIVVLPGRSK